MSTRSPVAAEFVKVAGVSELSDRKGKKVLVGDEEIALWRANGNIYAVNNVCPHQHFSVLHEATLEGIMLTCPMHGWTYSLETGMATSGSGRIKKYRVKVEGEVVFVEKPAQTR
jgi:nitrite reductase/ring-hydroxylating ferredoxin subunit